MPTTIPYASPQTRRPTHSLRSISLLLLFLTAVALFTCLRIEYLNARLNFPLPRNFTADPGRWRVSLIQNETRWRKLYSLKDPTLTSRPLNPPESAAMRAELTQNRLNSNFRDTVSTLGLLQYPLTLLLIIALPITFLQYPKPNPWRTPLALAFLSVLLCTTLMLYRGYFTSLGW